MRGDSTAFNGLVEDFSKDILYSASNLLYDPEEAEDVGQEVVLALFQSITKLKSPLAFYSYLQQTVRNICIRHNQKYKRLPTTDLDEHKAELAAPRHEEPETMFDQVEQVQRVGELLEQLPARQRQVLYYYYYGELSYKEIAEIMGVSVNTVGATINQAKANLKRMI